jgi:hypothetical protein
MKVQSNTRPEALQKLQGGLLINFDIAPYTKKRISVTEEGFEYEQVKVSTQPTRSEIIEAILLDKYPTGRQLALLYNKDDGNTEHQSEYTEYQAYRVFAKGVADEVLRII